MLFTATSRDFAALVDGKAPPLLHLAPDVELAPPPVLRMLAELADSIRPHFDPAAWMLVEAGEIVGLASLTRLPRDGQIHIGYGVAPTRQGRGIATRAVAELLAWARTDDRVFCVTAETAHDNGPSQRVLLRNGFVRSGERHDREDGRVICWRIDLR